MFAIYVKIILLSFL